METFHPSEKIVTHLRDFFPPISLSGTQKIKENASRVGVDQGRGSGHMLGVLNALFGSSTVPDWGKVFWGLCGYIESVCSEGICRSWKNEFHSEIAELKPWRHFSWIDLYYVKRRVLVMYWNIVKVNYSGAVNGYRIELAPGGQYFVYLQDRKLMSVNLNAQQSFPFSIFYVDSINDPGEEKWGCLTTKKDISMWKLYFRIMRLS